MNIRRMAVAGLASVGIMMGGAALASPASADTNSHAANGYWWPVLQQGQTSENVRALQWLLNCHGEKVAVPSHFGPKTYAAVKHYQFKAGNKPDGIVGAETWTSLTGRAPLGYGVPLNDCVKGLQVALNKWRYNDDLPISGYFGNRTKAKLGKFQSSHGLSVTYIADLQTWNKLIATPAGK